MDAELLGAAAFVSEAEIEKWKLVKFEFDNIWAFRSCGENHRFKDDFDAKRFIKRRGFQAALTYYLEETVKTMKGGDAG